MSNKIILIAFYLFLNLHLIYGLQNQYNLFMPDLPTTTPELQPLSSVTNVVHKTHSFAKNSFSKINLSGGPFDVQLNHILDPNNENASIDVEASEFILKSLVINVAQNDVLFIRLNEQFDTNNKTNTTITIHFFELNELHVDGMINVRCLNKIQSDKFRLHNHATGSIKLRLNVNTLDAYLHAIGRVKLCGQVNYEATIQSLGVGDVQCRSLFTKKINIISSGIGNIYVTATDEINITSSGIGSVYYTGPLKTQFKTGLGNIIQDTTSKK